jgi:SAM-dependent methyltransferase/4-amino-4-deoxy-L-arabinose transferase-like glycosyltransferase
VIPTLEVNRTEPITISLNPRGSVGVSSLENAASWRRPVSVAFPRVALRINGTHVWLSGIVLVGLVLRLIWVFYTDTLPLGGDPSWYFGVARNLFEGKGYVADHLVYTDHPILAKPTAFWPPAYPLLLASTWKITGFSLISAKVLNAVLGTATIPFVYLLGTAIFSRKVGLVSAAVFALYPNAIAWLPLLFPESMFILLFVAALWLLVAFPPSSTRSRLLTAGAFGLLTGVAALTRGQGLVLPAVAAIFWISRDGWKRGLAQALVVTLAAAVLIAPWTIRNWVVLGSPVVISTNAGVSLRTGHAPDATGTSKWTEDTVRAPDGTVFSAEQSPYDPEWEVTGYRIWTQRAVSYALTHPMRELDLTRYKIYYLYRSDSGVIPWLTTLGATPIQPASLQDHLGDVFDLSYYAVLFAAVAFMPLWLIRGDPKKQLMVNVLFVWTVFHVVFNGEPRYHVPLYPIFALSAVGGFGTIIAGWRQLGAEGLRRHGAIAEPEHAQELTRDAAFLRLNKEFYLLEENYDLLEVADSWRVESLFHRGRTRMLRRLLRRHGVAPYVDAGCGTGLLLRELPPGATGVDINPRVVPRAKCNAPAANVLTGDIESLPFRAGSVSTIVLTEVLEHFPNPADVLADLAALLRPGGTCIGSVPSQSLVWQLRFVSGSPAGEPFHKNYSKDELRELLEREFSNVVVGVGNCSMSVYFVATK